MISFSLSVCLQNTPARWLLMELALANHSNILWKKLSFFCFSNFILSIPQNISQLTVVYFSILKCPIFFGFHDPYLCCFFSYLFNMFSSALTTLIPPAHGNMDIHQYFLYSYKNTNKSSNKNTSYIPLQSLNDLIYFNHALPYTGVTLSDGVNIPSNFLDIFTWSFWNCSVQNSCH